MEKDSEYCVRASYIRKEEKGRRYGDSAAMEGDWLKQCNVRCLLSRTLLRCQLAKKKIVVLCCLKMCCAFGNK